jgi:urea transport system ATP-binding protein
MIATDPMQSDSVPPESGKIEIDPKPSPPAKNRRVSLLPKARKIEQHRVDALTVGRKALLCVDNVSVSFDGFKAISDLTLQDIITGKTKPDAGSVFLVGDNTDLTALSEYEIAERGICRKFQRPTVFQGHSVFENLELALPGKKGVFASLFARLSKPQRERIDEVLETIGLQEHKHAPAGRLSHGQKQWLEIGMLLAQEPRVLLVDEPVAGMTHQESEKTAELLSSLAGKRTVVVVEHDMEFVRSIARTVTVLHEGKILAEGSMDTVQNDPKVVEVYLGGAH